MAESLDSYSDIEDGDEDSVTELFHKAANHVKTLVSKLESPKLLELYAYYKQALEGTCNTPRPSWYEMQAKSKWDSWNKLGSLPQSDAKQYYINLVSELDPEFEKGEKTGSWVTVSSLAKPEEALDESDKTIFDYVKEGDLTKLTSKLKSHPKSLNEIDEDGMGLIHWAADRGDVNILKHLLNSKVDIDMLTEDGQTALHYAVSCDHFHCVKLLVEKGANLSIKDADGSLAIELTTDSNVLQLLSNES